MLNSSFSNSPYLPKNANLKQSKLRQVFERAPADAVNLAIGQPGEDTPMFIREAGKRAAMEAPLGYTVNAGIISLREKLASEFKFSVSPTQVCLTTGVQEALFACLYILCDDNSGDILLPNPGFVAYPAQAGLLNVKPRYYNLSAEDNFRFSADAVLSELRPETRGILLAHPSNPTGSDATYPELRKLIDGLKARKEAPVWIIADEVYYGMSYSDSAASLESFFEEYPYIILLRGASKSHHMTGWRLAWAVLPEVLVKPFIAIHQYLCTCVSAITQYSFDYIRGTQAEKDWLIYQNQLYKSKRDMVHQHLSPDLHLLGGEGAFYWMIDVKPWSNDGKNDESICWDMMDKARVTTAPGSAFGSSTNGYLRLSYGPPKDQLEKGLVQLKNYFKEL